MSFYIIETEKQLNELENFNDCFVDFISYNDNYHSKLSPLSLIYIRSLHHHKGYLICLKHNESLSLNEDKIINWLLLRTKKMFVCDKKKALYYFPHSDKLYDINFIKKIQLDKKVTNTCINYFYSKHNSLHNVNCLIPLSKHYEDKQNLYDLVLPIIKSFNENDVYVFNNNISTKVFYEIEKNGLTLDKTKFIEYYKDNIHNPEFNISKGKIYSHYNLYTTTSRPSNSFNNINFAALNKTDGERKCYIPENDLFIEYDYNGYHPRLIGELIDFNFDTNNVYETLSKLLDKDMSEIKTLTFKQIYGGVKKEYRDKPFFKDVHKYIETLWNKYNKKGYISTKNLKILNNNTLSSNKIFNYLIQSLETSHNVEILELIINYLSDKKTKLVLYTYDAFLFDFSKEDGKQTLVDIQNIMKYPTNIKQGNTYGDLQKI